MPRTMRSSVPPTVPLIPGDLASSRYSPLGAAVPTLPGLETPSAPKHIKFPNTPIDSDLEFEFTMFAFSVISASLQFLHLYRSVWWLPNSYTNHAMNFYLIDVNLYIFIIIILSRRILYIMGCKLLDSILPEKLHELGYFCYRLFLFGLIFCVLAICSYFVVTNHAVVNIFYLCYPISVYVILFGFTITPFFELINWNVSAPPPLHACTSNAAEIRSEVENLKTNFNNRMKQILFSSILNAYYAGFIPCCFTQNFLYYDVYWACQHVIFIFLSCFTAHAIHILPLRYCDTLHRATLHLGSWGRVETRSVLPAAYTWQDDMLWPIGSLVRHGREMYRAQGESNAAEPGNAMYSRFYAIFKNPSVALGGILLLHGILVLFQLALLLIRCIFWYHIMSITLLIFYNYNTLYKICRDYLVSLKIYRVEQDLRDKMPHH